MGEELERDFERHLIELKTSKEKQRERVLQRGRLADGERAAEYCSCEQWADC